MSNRRSRNKSSRTPNIGETKKSKKGLWIFAGVIFGLVASAWVVDRARHQQKTDQEKEAPKKETFEDLIVSDDYPKLKKIHDGLEREFFSAGFKKGSMLVKQENITKRVRLTDRMLLICKTKEQQNSHIKNKLKLLLLLETHAAVGNIEATTSLAEIQKVIEANRENLDKEVRLEIAMADLLLPIIKSYQSETLDFKENATLEGIEKMIDQNPDDVDLANRMQLLCKLILTKDPKQDDYVAALKILEEKYSDSSFVKIREIGRTSGVKRIMAAFRIPELENADSRISDRNQNLLDGIIAVLDAELLDAILANRLLGSCRRLENRMAYKKAAIGYSSIVEKLSVLADGDNEQKDDQSKNVESELTLAINGKTRCEAVGKKFPLEFTDQTGRNFQPADFDGDPVLVTIVGAGRELPDQVVLLQEIIPYRERQGLQLILLIQGAQTKKLQAFADQFEGQIIVVGNPVIDSKIHRAFPTTQPPAYLFLNGKQNMVDLTRNTPEVITRLDKLIFEVQSASRNYN